MEFAFYVIVYNDHPASLPQIQADASTLTRHALAIYAHLPVQRGAARGVAPGRSPVPPAPTATPWPTATPVPPTATPEPQPQTLAHLSGDQNAQSDTFTTSGEFTVSWSADMEDSSIGFGYFDVELYSATNNLPLEAIGNTTRSGSATYLVHDGCSGGCYLKVSSVNMSYSVTAQ